MKRSALLTATVAVAILGALLALTPQPREANAKLAEAPTADAAAAGAESSVPAVYPDAGFQLGEAGLTPEQRAGREIWYKATAGNARFHTYTFQQRVGVLIDWGRVLRSDRRDRRFRTWGLINDPGCCTPGSANCPAKSLDETYGFDWCPGDEELLKFVGREGYRDPACDFKEAPADANDPAGHRDGRDDGRQNDERQDAGQPGQLIGRKQDWHGAVHKTSFSVGKRSAKPAHPDHAFDGP